MIAAVVAVVLALLLIVRDVYARRRERTLLAEIASLREQVKATDRLANVGRLMSGLAQDLKSPLQGMLGSAEVLAASSPQLKANAQELEDIRDNVARAAGIVRNLLTFTETNALRRRWQDLNDVIRRAIDHLRPHNEHASRVHFESTPRLPLVYVDGRQLERVVVTILEHTARLSRPRAGSTLVSVTRHGPPDDRLVVDIDDATLPLVDDVPEWAGDLDGCRRVLEAHGGSLEVERQRAGGIRFHLALPVTEHVETEPS
ncbi:MAG TPA: histidine kinase dimerization/phospho-acceptor domain-containing protein [Vicinamibacterales bacterium]|nr:histidine kinase dimerization/phospho-acceptor domain-containing protein [Vicinamibacterales bacterium]